MRELIYTQANLNLAGDSLVSVPDLALDRVEWDDSIFQVTGCDVPLQTLECVRVYLIDYMSPCTDSTPSI